MCETCQGGCGGSGGGRIGGRLLVEDSAHPFAFRRRIASTCHGLCRYLSIALLFCLQVGHTDYVSALAYAPPGTLEACPGAAVVSGSRDNSVIVWDLATATPVQRLEGHHYQVRSRQQRQADSNVDSVSRHLLWQRLWQLLVREDLLGETAAGEACKMV